MDNNTGGMGGDMIDADLDFQGWSQHTDNRYQNQGSFVEHQKTPSTGKHFGLITSDIAENISVKNNVSFASDGKDLDLNDSIRGSN
jgi:hypothetical protein